MQGTYREVRSFERPCIKKNEALVFHSTARAIPSINSLSHGKNENIPNINREFANNSLKTIFHEISRKPFSQGIHFFKKKLR